MIIKHHPSDTTLVAFAARTLDEGRGLVVAAHVSLCDRCRGAVRTFECFGGKFLDDIAPVPLSADALERAFERVQQPEEILIDAGRRRPDSNLPVPLSRYPLGSWRWIGRGVQWRPVDIASGSEVRVFMLRAAPGTRLPRHKHGGTEWTCVFEGAFRHDLGRYGPGDFDEADQTVEHNPVVEDDVACVCLVALQGNIELQSWIGRLIQPLIRL
jgi:putative transcriptional regulator